MKKAKVRHILQIVYDLFCGSGGIWPTVAELQQELNRRGYYKIDAARTMRQIDVNLLQPRDTSGGCPPPLQRLIMTAESIKFCTNSAEDIANLLTAVKWLGRRMEQLTSTVDQSERGMRFTTQQLAEAVPVDIDSSALRRLIAILQAEGWIHGDHAIQREA